MFTKKKLPYWGIALLLVAAILWVVLGSDTRNPKVIFVGDGTQNLERIVYIPNKFGEHCEALVVGGEYIYCLISPDASIVQLNKETLEIVGVVKLPFWKAEGIVTDGEYLYITEWKRPPRILRIELDGLQRQDMLDLNYDSPATEVLLVDEYLYVVQGAHIGKVNTRLWRQARDLDTKIDSEDRNFFLEGLDAEGKYLYASSAFGDARLIKIKLDEFTVFETLEILTNAIPIGASGSHPQGVASDGTYLYATNSFNLYRMSKDGEVLDTRANAHLAGTDMAQVNGICIRGDYIYLGSSNYPTIPKLGYIKVFNKTDLSYVGEYQVKNYWVEGATYYKGNWWVVYYKWEYASRYNDEWVWQADYSLALHDRMDIGGNFTDGNYLYVTTQSIGVTEPRTAADSIVAVYQYEDDAFTPIEHLFIVQMEQDAGKEPGSNEIWWSDYWGTITHTSIDYGISLDGGFTVNTIGLSEKYGEGLVVKDGYGYVVCKMSPGVVIKVDLERMVEIGKLTFSQGWDEPKSGVVINGNSLYCLCKQGLVEIDLSEFRETRHWKVEGSSREGITVDGNTIYICR